MAAVLTEWMHDFTRPRISFLESGDPKNPIFHQVVHIQFGRHRIIKDGEGAFQDVLGSTQEAVAIKAFTGLKEIFAGTSADREFVCIVDEEATEVAHADIVRQNQVWEMKKEPELFSFPTPAP